MPISISGTNGVTLSGQFDSASSFGFKNRIINSAMVIDQRNAGASVTYTNTVGYGLDRWRNVALGTSLGFSVQRSATAPVGFVNSLLATVTSAKTPASSDQARINQYIEGFNVADLGWGTVNAQTITLSFWVRSSVTGTYCVVIGNADSATRSYVATYTINSANTWEQKSITIAGDTSGTWTTSNSVGMGVSFSLNCGSNFNASSSSTWYGAEYLQTSAQANWIGTSGATFYITGVQLEKGSTATSFDYRPYTTELQLCQRYYESTAFPDAGFGIGATRIGVCLTTTAFSTGFNFLVPKRTNSPTVTLYSRNGNSGKVSLISTGADVSGTSTVSNLGGTGFWGVALGTSQTAGAGIETGWTASAEL